ncbi:NADP-dependent phosphogluconate dehydrogenase [Spongiivirga citrea]|uniref:6-phosphogluconate dehydrogenase, decarboxylating n=2 Tax=Spongiivirga citrea TaxID=1481457 RepID=A0A6M0CKN8_9FLAO|nr:NADP-dependent phosphogluconate dehydrogenase [Spongiivirga citrea]
MGVSGVGKTTIGLLLSEKIGIPFFDGDDFHPEVNKKKMEAGEPLNDGDRLGWLKSLNELAQEKQSEEGAVIACSALKDDYRQLLRQSIKSIYFVHLEGSFELISERMKQRENHFMPEALLQSQFDALENPKKALTFSITMTPEEITNQAVNIITNKTEFGLIGLGVMGKSLCRNLANNGFNISMYNRHVDEKEVDIAKDFKAEFPVFKNSLAFDNLGNFVASMQQPRKIMLMVNAGKPVDYVIADLEPYLDKGDIIIDGGNSHFEDTKRRIDYLKEKEIHFVGTGVSGGEEGALKGPSIMPSGNKEAYDEIAPYLDTIAAVDKNGKGCCTYVGPEGSGHYIKMVHNGIEYAEMQLLAEVYQLLRTQGKTPSEIADLMGSWTKTELNSFLLEITVNILRKKEGEGWLIDKILDKAGNKGTGNWTTVSAANLGIPATVISSALFARYVSAFKETRIKMVDLYEQEKIAPQFDIDTLKEAYTAARIINHHQGFDLINEASKTYSWNLNLSEIARVWTNGCIVRSELMESLVNLFTNSDKAILFQPSIVDQVKSLKNSLKMIVIASIESDAPIPCFSEALTYLNSMTTKNLSANMIQAQRDYFGAHTYERVDKKGTFHTDWLGS